MYINNSLNILIIKLIEVLAWLASSRDKNYHNLLTYTTECFILRCRNKGFEAFFISKKMLLITVWGGGTTMNLSIAPIGVAMKILKIKIDGDQKKQLANMGFVVDANVTVVAENAGNL